MKRDLKEAAREAIITVDNLMKGGIDHIPFAATSIRNKAPAPALCMDLAMLDHYQNKCS